MLVKVHKGTVSTYVSEGSGLVANKYVLPTDRYQSDVHPSA